MRALTAAAIAAVILAGCEAAGWIGTAKTVLDTAREAYSAAEDVADEAKRETAAKIAEALVTGTDDYCQAPAAVQDAIAAAVTDEVAGSEHTARILVECGNAGVE